VKSLHIIFYSGVHDINSLGATRTIDMMLVKHMADLGHRVTWAGLGEMQETPYTHNFQKKGLSKFIERVCNKLEKIIFSTNAKKSIRKQR